MSLNTTLLAPIVDAGIVLVNCSFRDSSILSSPLYTYKYRMKKQNRRNSTQKITV
jgi:hypothetical protein